MSLPSVAVTLGDPAGIGPEIAVKALAELGDDSGAAFVLVGDSRVVVQAVRRFAPGLHVGQLTRQTLPGEPGVYVLDVPYVGAVGDSSLPVAGSAEVGRAAYDALEAASRLALDGRVGALVTGPLNKEALALAGHVGVGHTELLADLCGVPRSEVVMMLASDRLRVAHVSTHVPLRVAVDSLSSERIVTVGRLAAEATEAAIGRPPVVAVAGVNPHAGEGGLFGTEELEHIAPAVAELRVAGVNAVGPLPPDTVFARAVRGDFDVVIAMYHDQGHIPAKLLGFAETVNVTLGLPIVRVSVDHGTAYDIAWQGKADATNMGVALRYGLRAARAAHG